MPMRVLAIVPAVYDTSPGQRFRLEQWAPLLRQRGRANWSLCSPGVVLGPRWRNQPRGADEWGEISQQEKLAGRYCREWDGIEGGG